MTPDALLRENRRRALRAAESVGQRQLKAILARSHADLLKRVVEAEGLRGPGRDSFTAVQARAVLAQIDLLLREIKPGMKDLLVGRAGELGADGAADVASYLALAERQFAGAARPLGLDQAVMLDRSRKAAERTVLSRILSDPTDRRRPGVLDRYGQAVIADFEATLQQRVLAQKPWTEVRDELREQSPFLKGKPMFWAERIVRTESIAANNAGSQEAIASADEQLGGMLKILSSAFDDRTGSDSYAVHGQIRRVSEKFDTWFGPVMHPPDRPNDRAAVVPHRIGWPLPASLKPRTDAEVMARWRAEKRKGAPPPRPLMSTVDLAKLQAPSAPAQESPKPAPAPVSEQASFEQAAKRGVLSNPSPVSGNNVNFVFTARLGNEPVYAKPGHTNLDVRKALEQHRSIRLSAEALGVADMVTPAALVRSAKLLREVGRASADVLDPEYGVKPEFFVTRAAPSGAVPAFAQDPAIIAKVSQTDRLKVAVLDFIHGNADRHDGNVLVDSRGRLTLIDHDNIGEAKYASSVFFPGGGIGYAAPQKALSDLPDAARRFVSEIASADVADLAARYSCPKKVAEDMKARAKSVERSGLDAALVEFESWRQAVNPPEGAERIADVEVR